MDIKSGTSRHADRPARDESSTESCNLIKDYLEDFFNDPFNFGVKSRISTGPYDT